MSLGIDSLIVTDENGIEQFAIRLGDLQNCSVGDGGKFLQLTTINRQFAIKTSDADMWKRVLDSRSQPMGSTEQALLSERMSNKATRSTLCVNCGIELRQGLRFCTKCGALNDQTRIY